jgi:hypothetical protein
MTLFFNMDSIFNAERGEVPPDILLSSKVLASTTQANFTMFVLTIGNLYFLFLFNLLFGTYIFNDANNCGTYIFSRLKDRRTWFYRKARELMMFSFCYTALVIATLAAISLWESKRGIDEKMLIIAVLLLFYFTLLSALTSVAISLLAFRWGSIIAFLIIYFIEVMLVLSLLIPVHTTFSRIWNYFNPFGGIFSLEELSGRTVYHIAYPVALFILFVYLGGKYITRMDIGLKDVESE